MLTAGKTFSAGIMTLIALRDNATITIVGEPAGAPYSSYGDPVSRQLTRAGLELHVSTVLNQLDHPADISEATPVDVPAPFAFADYIAGRDPAVDAIVNGTEMRSIPDHRDDRRRCRGDACIRRAQGTFARYPWWHPPEELDLRRAGTRSLAQKRVRRRRRDTHSRDRDRARELAHVVQSRNAETARGIKGEALKSYRRVLDVDPDNPNRSTDSAAADAGARARP